MVDLEKIAVALDELWEDRIHDPCSKLPTLFDIDEIDPRWLPFLKPLLGFTADIPFNATTEELRRILRVAMEYWNKKPSEVGVIDIAIRMVTGNRFRVQNYFDFRMQVDNTIITEELQDYDPSVIAFFAPTGEYPSGSLIDLGQTAPDEFELLDATKDLTTEDEQAFLILSGDVGAPSNDAIYRILSVISTTRGKVHKPFPRAEPASAVNWKVLFYMDEFITEVRLVDPGRGTLEYDGQTVDWTVGEKVYGVLSGATGIIEADQDSGDFGTLTLRSLFGRFQNEEALAGNLGGAAVAKGTLAGVLNRDLIDYLIKTVLPVSERVNVVYINFLDRFLTPTDLDQWILSDPDLISVPDPGGIAILFPGQYMIAADNEAQYWDDQTTAWKLAVISSACIARCLFFVTDINNCYFVELDYGAKTIKLFKRVGGVDTQIGPTVAVPVIVPLKQDCVRVDALAEGGDTRIRVKLNGELRIDELDSPATFTAGSVGYEADGSVCLLVLVEVNVIPTEIQRVGPNP